jgi:hypothetical protein
MCEEMYEFQDRMHFPGLFNNAVSTSRVMQCWDKSYSETEYDALDGLLK